VLVLYQDEVRLSTFHRSSLTSNSPERVLTLLAHDRPGLASFLSRISQVYEMHVYTMGTRAYAIEVCKVIDPTGALFGGRILSRDESGSKSLSPFSQNEKPD
jgi:TFIIF-interacting CTD phosphatase-like protein